MAGRFRQLVGRIYTLAGAKAETHSPACEIPAQSAPANLQECYGCEQTVATVRAFNAARIGLIEDERAISNMTARDARRAVITRPVQF